MVTANLRNRELVQHKTNESVQANKKDKTGKRDMSKELKVEKEKWQKK